MIQALEVHNRLVAFHLEAMRVEDQRLVLARVFAGNARKLSGLLYRNERRIADRLQVLEEVVCTACGAERDVAPLSYWAALHLSCCLGEAFALLQRDELLPLEPPA